MAKSESLRDLATRFELLIVRSGVSCSFTLNVAVSHRPNVVHCFRKRIRKEKTTEASHHRRPPSRHCIEMSIAFSIARSCQLIRPRRRFLFRTASARRKAVSVRLLEIVGPVGLCDVLCSDYRGEKFAASSFNSLFIVYTPARSRKQMKRTRGSKSNIKLVPPVLDGSKC